MIRKIGKYDIRDPIGRGGMGVVFRAHDPVLDRPVALKVISDDVEVTDELRTRFFREAQACGKLSHPNIVTVYDMGEDAGRLYIAMELLDGEELRRVIGERRRMPLEDKLDLMIQICDGLDYAHQKGVIHRDIKPGNIIVLRDGVAKIVDFGIAQMAGQSGVTRTGLVMGTLRYISPEQADGHADSRSDMFSVAAVFYELLAYRPALAGADPIQLLEQLRAEEPTPLAQVDPAIPTDLSDIVARALRRAPAERFVSLGQMRAELLGVRRRLSGAAAEARTRIAERQERARRLQSALGAALGGAPATEPIAALDDRTRLDALLAVDVRLAEETAELERLLRRAEGVAPALERGQACLAAGQLEEAIVELEGVLAEMPEHERAAAALRDARRQVVEAEQRVEMRRRLEEAGGAFERGAYRECLDILARVGAAAAALGLGSESAGLQRAAEAAIAAQEVAHQEELRRQRKRAEVARPLVDEARRMAEEVEAPRRAADSWRAAEERAAQGQAALGGDAFVPAAEAFEEARSLYERAVDEARRALRAEEQRRQQAQAERARERMDAQRAAASAVDAGARAAALWQAATARAEEGQAFLGQEAFLRATQAFEEATGLYRRAEEATRETIRREELGRQRELAEQAQAASARARAAAQSADAPGRAASLWQVAESRDAEARASAGRGAHAEAARLFGEAAGAYGDGQRAAEAQRQQERQQAGQALERAGGSRRDAEAAGAAGHTSDQWAAAEGALALAREAFERDALASAVQRAQEADALYRRAAQAAHAVLERQREEAAQARARATQHRVSAGGRDAERLASALWVEADAALAGAETALGAGDYRSAGAGFSAAAELFARAETAAVDALRREEEVRRRSAAEGARNAMEGRRASARAAQADRAAEAPWREAEAMASEAAQALERGRLAEAPGLFDQAAALFQRAEDAAHESRHHAEAARERAAAELARERMAPARAVAAEVGAARWAPALWAQAEDKAGQGRAALARADYARAAAVLEEARSGYAEAERAAREGMRAEEVRRQQQMADHARDLMARRRAMAADQNAQAGDATLWASAEAQAQEGERALSLGNHTDAIRAFGSATALFRRAEEATQLGARPVRAAAAPVEPAPVVEPPARGAPSAHADDPDATRFAAPVPGPAELDSDSTVVVSRGPSTDTIVVGPVAHQPEGASGRSPARSRRALAAGVAAAVLLGVVGWLAWPGSRGEPREPADQARGAAVAAREEAERAGAGKNAADAVARGRREEQQAAEAFGRQQYGAAREGFGRAAAAYRDAGRTAESLRSEMEAARAQAGRGRKAAAEAQAGDFGQEHGVRDAFREGTRKHAEADGLGSGQAFSGARDAYGEASQSFVAATARAQLLVGQRTAAEEARQRMAAEKARAAAAARSGGYRAAAAKEDEAGQAFRAFRYPEAGDGFRAAGELYAKAASESKPAGDPVPRPGASPWLAYAEHEREFTRKVRAEAERAGASQSVPQSMERGRRQQSQGDQAFTRENYEAASRAFAVARAIFQDARSAADELKAQAEQARDRMRAEKRRGSSQAPDYATGLAREADGDRALEQLLFTQAKDAYRTAAGLYASTAGPAPATKATTGSIVISGNVAGADLWVGNLRVSAQAPPVEVEKLSPGRYRVRVARAGYRDWQQEVEVTAGARTQVRVSLEAKGP